MLAIALGLVCAAPLPLPRVAHAQGAEPDSALGRFLGGLADSTDRYFGLSAAAPDTAGLDSALAERLLHPPPARRRVPVSLWPDVRFDRVDGTSWGGGIGVGRDRERGRLAGRLLWATGSRTRLGGGDYRRVLGLGDHALRLSLGAGRSTDAMDRDHTDHRFALIRALVYGSDRRHLLRRDGAEAGLDHEAGRWRIGVGYRDQLERPLEVTTTWNLKRAPLSVPGNLPARAGRAREMRLSGGMRLPGTPLDLGVTHLTSGRRLDSDFEYRRTRVSLGGDIGLGRHFSALPQLAYGRLRGEGLPQESFYLGGPGTLRALASGEQGGTGTALARIDVITTFDVLAAARVPHPAAFPLQLGVFGGSGAVWGVDPYGGGTRPGIDWPREGDWRSEAGVSFLYQPGLPSPDDLLRVDWAWPLGPRGGGPRLSLSYSHALGLVPGSGR